MYEEKIKLKANKRKAQLAGQSISPLFVPGREMRL